MKKYLSLIGIILLTLIVGRLGYQAFFAYLSEHTYYFSMLSSGANWGIFVSAIVCSFVPIGYLFISSKVKIRNLIIFFLAGAGVFGLIHANIKGDPVGFGHLITIFNTILLVSLGIYLILGFSALGSWIERKWIKFNQLRRQEIFLSFGIGFCSFVIIVQILLGIGLLYGIVSRILFLGLGFMVRHERKQLSKWGEIIGSIFDSYKTGIIGGEWNLNSKKFWTSNKIGLLIILLPIILSLAYLYMGIQNSFVPYSTAWDANHEYMYIPKILAENAGIYRGNTVANSMPGFWHQFLTFVFSLTGCTNGWFGLSSDNIAISMNNLSAAFVLIFGIAIIFQIFTLINDKEEKNDEKSGLKKGKSSITKAEISNGNGITIGRYFLLLRLTGGMGAFLVIVDNKTDLGVMALSLLALLAGLIFLQNRKSNNKKEILKYVLIAGLFFGFAALAKITAFVDLVLFGLLLIGLRFSSLTSLGIGVMVMGFVRKFNILTSSSMLSDENAMWFIIVGGVITFIGIVIHLLKSNSNREKFYRDIRDLFILGIGFLIPLIILKLPRTTINQIKDDNFSIGNSLRSVFLGMNTIDDDDMNNKKFLVQNSGINPVFYDKISNSGSTDIDSITNGSGSKRVQTSFSQCLKAGNIYSEDELNENLQEIIGSRGNEDLGRYMGYGWKEFKKTNLFSIDENIANKKWFKFFRFIRPQSSECVGVNGAKNVICEKNLVFGLMKKLWPTSKSCYGLNHDAKVLCNNADVIDNFKIDDLRGIYENEIKNKEGEVGLLLKQTIDAYNKAKSEGKLGFGVSNTAVFHDEIVNLRQYYQSHSISSTEDSINIPYRYLVPLNISFNRSLQNLSSYYTDIGFFWIIVYIFLLIALPYAIIKKDRILTCIALTTLIGWGIWRIIGSSILWYGTVLISWTMITIAMFWDRVLQKNGNLNFIARILIFVVGIFFGLQLLFNFLRISSQGATSVFVRYKGNMGTEQLIDDNLTQGTNSKLKRGFGWKDVFDLQFSQYNPVINALATRDNSDGVIVAGTYIQYFLGNQWNVKADAMLLDFWKKTSDGDLCKTYRRLKNDNSRYLIIDPNIGTVTMGEGNETLFYRFFAKLNGDQSEIEMDGTITTLVKLYEAGYLKLLSTNNLGAKYAFVVSDDIIRQHFGEDLTDEDITLIRAKMSVLKYFNDANYLFSNVVNMFISRLMSNPQDGIEDLANIYGLEIDSGKVANVANKVISSYQNGNPINGFAKGLTQNEKNVLISYMNIYLGYTQGGEDSIGNFIQSLIFNSVVNGGSQIIALELN